MLDLNFPPSDIIEQEGTSQTVGLEVVAGHPVEAVPLDTIDVEAIEDDVIESSATAFAEVKEIIKPQPPPREPTFNCTICMGSLTEETSTRCGHIFCKACIKAEIAAQGKCPTCRKRVTVKELIRVFLPSAS
ncbi:hypothetical protein V6N13_045133 [Hibiscus sabdariffa]